VPFREDVVFGAGAEGGVHGGAGGGLRAGDWVSGVLRG